MGLTNTGSATEQLQPLLSHGAKPEGIQTCVRECDSVILVLGCKAGVLGLVFVLTVIT